MNLVDRLCYPDGAKKYQVASTAGPVFQCSSWVVVHKSYVCIPSDQGTWFLTISSWAYVFVGSGTWPAPHSDFLSNLSHTMLCSLSCKLSSWPLKWPKDWTAVKKERWQSSYPRSRLSINDMKILIYKVTDLSHYNYPVRIRLVNTMLMQLIKLYKFEPERLNLVQFDVNIHFQKPIRVFFKKNMAPQHFWQLWQWQPLKRFANLPSWKPEKSLYSLYFDIIVLIVTENYFLRNLMILSWRILTSNCSNFMLSCSNFYIKYTGKIF